MTTGPQRFTVVSFHAHPDDEALLTAGTLARAAAAGHRVVLVIGTDGEAGLAESTDHGPELGRIRRDELMAAADAIGAAAVHFLGFRDSGYSPAPASCSTAPTVPAAPTGTRVSFAQEVPSVVALRVAEILIAEQADVLTIYDPCGGYGHPDHVQVHRAGQIAARLAQTAVVLEATLDRDVLATGVRLLRRLSRVLAIPAMPELADAYTAHRDLTHRVDVRRHLPAKLAALRAHRSQAAGGESVRTLAWLLRLPWPVRNRVLGTEWFREIGRPATGVLLDDIFATLRLPAVGERTDLC